MSNVLHRTTKEYKKSVNTPDFPSASWAINPSGVDTLEASSVPTKYWKLTGTHPNESVFEMNSTEKIAVDDNPTNLAALKAQRYAEIDEKTSVLNLDNASVRALKQQISDAATTAAVDAVVDTR